MNPIATIRTPYPEKFGVPRQSGMVHAESRIIFKPEFRNPDALRGLDGFTHIWIIWVFSENIREEWSPTVRPPRLGGNIRMGVFATRSPFRPNPIGLSCVKIERIELQSPHGPVIHISGADMMDGTPILDIKPYLPLADCIPEAKGGFTDTDPKEELQVTLPSSLRGLLSPDDETALIRTLELDPRPSYQNDPEREYGFLFSQWEVHFKVDQHRLTVISIKPTP